MKYIILFLISFVHAQTFQSLIQRLEQLPEERRQPMIERYLNTQRSSPIIENDSTVHFVLYGAADTVYVNGNLQHWNKPELLQRLPCGPFTFFYKTFVIPPDSRIDYLLTVDGKPMLDPQNLRVTPSGYGDHSELRMPKFSSSPYLQKRDFVPRGAVDSLAPALKIPTPLNHYSVSLRPIKVYRPPGYDTLAHLPSMYVHDGFEAITFAHMTVILDNLIAEKKIPPVIAVFIPPVERQEEYVTKKRDPYIKYLCDVLVPIVDEYYRTERSSLKRGIMGMSNGGHISLITALQRPDIFQNAGGQSSTITPYLTETVQRQYDANRISPRLKIYLDCGRYDIKTDSRWFGKFDFLESNRNFSNLLASMRIPHYYKEVNDGHEWASWRERIPEMLIYFFGQQQ